MERIFLTAISLFALGCGTFPAKYVWEVDLDTPACVRREIIDKDNMRVGDPQDFPLAQCNGVFGFQAEDAGKVFSWTRRAVQKCKANAMQLQAQGATNGNGTLGSCSK